MSVVAVNGLEMFVRVEGAGYPLFLLHGLGLDHTYWRLQQAAFSSVFQTISYDLRGHGKTRGDGAATLEQHARDLAGLMAALGIDRAHIVGLSLGSHISKQFAAMYPDKLNRLVLVSTRPAGNGSTTKSIIEHYMASGIDIGIDRMLHIAADAYFCPETGPEIRQQFYNSALYNSKESYLLAMEALTGFDHTANLGRMTMPTLIVCGQEDRLTTVNMAEQTHRLLPDAQLLVLAKAGHLCNLEQPDAFNRGVLAFLSGH